jgi:hypothetical protein
MIDQSFIATALSLPVGGFVSPRRDVPHLLGGDRLEGTLHG